MTAVTTNTSPWAVDSNTAFTNRNLAETSAKSNASIDMNGFLRLLTTQMQHQDPFQPMDNNQMVTQMAQMSSLASQSQSTSLLSQIADSVSGARLSDAAGWIGKSMLVESNIATPDRTGAYAGEIALGADASNVSIDLVDASGKVVQSFDLGAQSKGNVPFFWDGRDDAGNMIGGQALQVKVRGATPAGIATWASIAAVQSPASGGNAQLMTALGNFSPEDALRLG
ncbi:flagellar basal-body rod modification protein FlgD [Sphingobium sp. B7D2B]|uniref:flagellar hook assembly protein FlgD n=1 Tax=Sphingobium sp. B7D2B TaxID=2940583 RepID=UPI002224F85B|nr:flagellar hook capping FlgD N-terminal domain-containing protein [Sphingobium sp. B7D2B]MCW2366130.1 flagellar basal-body rod modification protein FlgD [Sphingobium sp. B7D2B]